MAEKKDGHEKGEHEGGKKPKKHLHKIETEATVDHKGKVTGYVSHHTYKDKATDHHHEPSKPMAVHDTAEEAGEHLAQQFGAQEGGGGAEAPHDEAAEAAEAGAAGGGAAAGPEAGI